MQFDHSEARHRMCRAAAYLGVAAGLRPGELLGSSQAPERALRRDQLRFFSDEAATLSLMLPVASQRPRVLEVMLRLTKTSQFAPVYKFVTAPDAVEAVWTWFAETHDRGSRATLFQLLPGADQLRLSTFALVRFLERPHAASGLGSLELTGKSWRMGGASSLALQGLEPADIAALGWAADSHMWERYARDPQVQRQRAIARGALMQPSRSRPVAAAAAEVPEPRR
jgi:hypothetical protein